MLKKSQLYMSVLQKQGATLGGRVGIGVVVRVGDGVGEIILAFIVAKAGGMVGVGPVGVVVWLLLAASIIRPTTATATIIKRIHRRGDNFKVG